MSGGLARYYESEQHEGENFYDQSDFSDNGVAYDSPNRSETTYFKNSKDLNINGGNFISAGGSVSTSDHHAPQGQRRSNSQRSSSFFEGASGSTINDGQFIAANGNVHLPSPYRAAQNTTPSRGYGRGEPRREHQRANTAPLSSRPSQKAKLPHSPSASERTTSFFEGASGSTITDGQFIAANGNVHLPSPYRAVQNTTPSRGYGRGEPSEHHRASTAPLSESRPKLPPSPSASERTTSSSLVAIPPAGHSPTPVAVNPVAVQGTTNLLKSAVVPSTEHDPSNSTVNPAKESTANNTNHTVHPSLTSATVGITFQGALNDDADKDLISIYRHPKKEALYKLLQTEIRYGVDGGVPYSILAFRLETAKDKKDCLKVELKGEIVRTAPYQSVNVKEIKCMPERIHELIQVPVQHAEATSVQVAGGITAGKPTFLATVDRIESNTITLMQGQTSDSEFDDSKGTFVVNLGVDNPVRKQLSVVNPARFVVLLKLEEDRQPMNIKLTLAVTYRRRSGRTSEPLCKSIEQEYPGTKFYDIVKGKRAVLTTAESSG